MHRAVICPYCRRQWRNESMSFAYDVVNEYIPLISLARHEQISYAHDVLVDEEACHMLGKVVPAEVHFLLTFLNTRYGQQHRLHDDWPDPSALEDWLHAQDLLPAERQVTEGDYRRALALREALRHILRSRADDVPDALAVADALETFNHIARHTLLKVQLAGPMQAHLIPESSGVDGVLARVLGDVYTVMGTERWLRLKVCHNGACRRAFYDSSKNHAGVWCSTRTCGDRMRARTYRQQRKQGKLV